MFPFPYTGLRLIHDEKVRDAMERACIHSGMVSQCGWCDRRVSYCAWHGHTPPSGALGGVR